MQRDNFEGTRYLVTRALKERKTPRKGLHRTVDQPKHPKSYRVACRKGFLSKKTKLLKNFQNFGETTPQQCLENCDTPYFESRYLVTRALNQKSGPEERSQLTFRPS